MAQFLVTTQPVTGHVSPLLPVAQALVGRGHEVRWYNSKRFQRRIERTGATFVPFQKMQDIDYHNLNERFPERARLKGIAQAKWDMKFIIDLSFEQYDDLATIVAQDRPDVIVGDFLTWGAQFMAESQAIPYAVINPLNLGVPSRDTAPDGLGLAPSATPVGRLRNRALNWFLPHIILRDIQAYLNQRLASKGLPPVTESIFAFPFRARLFLQPTIPAFEYPRSDLPDHIRFIGALIPEAPNDFTRPDWWPELDSDRPVVLVTQGTVATNLDELLNPALEGLAGEDMLVIGTTAGQSRESVKLDPLPANVHLERFVPFAQLMPHVDVMVTNGGYGGTHFALTHGVPLVAGGKSEDKAEICARIAWSGVGINLDTASPAPEQIRDAVKAVLRDGRYRERARAIQAEFARYDAPSTAADLLEQLVTTGEPMPA